MSLRRPGGWRRWQAMLIPPARVTARRRRLRRRPRPTHPTATDPKPTHALQRQRRLLPNAWPERAHRATSLFLGEALAPLLLWPFRPLIFCARGLSEPSVLAMIVKLLEHRRTHRGDWGEFEAQLLLRSAERFAFLRASDPHHAFWRWAWNQISFF